ncbi:glycosyltransferase, partial [Tessaracoccus lubricantis]
MTAAIALVCPYSLDRPGGVATHVLGLASWLRDRGHDAFVVAPGTGVPGDGTQLVGPAVGVPFNGSVAQLAVLPAQARRTLTAIADADVVHVHEPLTPGIAFAAARAARGRLVVTHHAHFRPGLFTAPLRLRASLLPLRTSIAVSEAACRTAVAVTGLVPAVIPNAVAVPPA